MKERESTLYFKEEYEKEKNTFAGIIGSSLRERGETISTAESCTGGYLSHLLTS